MPNSCAHGGIGKGRSPLHAFRRKTMCPPFEREHVSVACFRSGVFTLYRTVPPLQNGKKSYNLNNIEKN